MNVSTVAVQAGRLVLDRKRCALACVWVLAVAAPIMPSTVLTKGYWLAGAVLVLRWRKLTAVDGVAVALALWASAAALGRLSVPAAQLGISNYWSVCLIFVAVRCTVGNRHDVATSSLAYLAGCCWAAVEIIRQGITLTATADTEVRLGLAGVNVNYTAYAMATGVVVAIAVARTSPLPKRVNLMAQATVPMLAYATLGTGTRGAQISIVLALVYAIVSRFAPRASWRVAAFGSPALLLLVPLGLYGDKNLLWVQEYLGRATNDLSGRTNIWPVAREVWADHLWTGVGPGMFPLHNSFGIGAHSVVISVGAELGVVGLVLFAAVVVSALSAAGRGLRARQPVGLLIVAWLPIWLSGAWELSPAAWIALALWSRMSDNSSVLSSPDGTDSVSTKIRAKDPVGLRQDVPHHATREQK